MNFLRRKTEDSPSDVAIKQAGNGYIVIRYEKLERPRKRTSILGEIAVTEEPHEYVFGSLADVTEFLSDHFQDTKVKI